MSDFYKNMWDQGYEEGYKAAIKDIKKLLRSGGKNPPKDISVPIKKRKHKKES